MERSGAQVSIEEHGWAMDEDKKEVRCKYCGKKMQGFDRLEHHLGGVGSDVPICRYAEADVMQHMRDHLIAKRKERLAKEGRVLSHSDCPLKRNISSPPAQPKSSANGYSSSGTPILADGNRSVSCVPVNQPSPGDKGKNVVDQTPAQPKSSTNGYSASGKSMLADGNNSVSCVPVNQPSPGDKGKNVMDQTPGGHNGNESASIIEKVAADVIVEEEPKDISECLRSFLDAAGLDPNAVELPAFQKLMDVAMKSGSGLKLPKADELRGSVGSTVPKIQKIRKKGSAGRKKK